MIRHERRQADRKRFGLLAAFAAVLLCAAVPRSASAEAVLNLVTSGSLSMVQGNTGTLTISATNAGPDQISLTAFSVGLQLVADGAVTGSLTFGDFLGTGSVWTNPATTEPALLSLDAPLNGTTEYYGMGITVGLEDAYVFQPSSSAVLGTIEFTASPNAEGSWRLFVVNEWPSGLFPVTYVDDDNFASQQFANVATTEGGAGTTFQVGTITVAVPEPSGLALALLGAAAAVAGLRLTRRRTASASHFEVGVPTRGSMSM